MDEARMIASREVAPGPDGVPWRVWGEMMRVMAPRVRLLFTSWSKEGANPRIWRTARLVLLRKEGRPALVSSGMSIGWSVQFLPKNHCQNHCTVLSRKCSWDVNNDFWHQWRRLVITTLSARAIYMQIPVSYLQSCYARFDRDQCGHSANCLVCAELGKKSGVPGTSNTRHVSNSNGNTGIWPFESEYANLHWRRIWQGPELT